LNQSTGHSKQSKEASTMAASCTNLSIIILALNEYSDEALALFFFLRTEDVL
jgi:hypothetical protein